MEIILSHARSWGLGEARMGGRIPAVRRRKAFRIRGQLLEEDHELTQAGIKEGLTSLRRR